MNTASINPATALEIDLWLKQAAKHRRAGALAQAVALYRQVLARVPNHPDALREMGTAALETGALEVAQGFVDRAVKEAPRSPAALVAQARVALAAGQPAKAIGALRKASRHAPEQAGIALLLGEAHLDAGDIEPARRAFREALRLAPGHARASHMVAALDRDARSEARNAYAAGLFDRYAGFFDSHLVAALKYNAPAELRALVNDVAPQRPFGQALDLGCGTGLVAEAFAGSVDRWDGIDLAPGMIEAARAKGLYARLETADLEEFLARADRAGAYDLIVAADVFIYVGELARTFAGVAAALKPQGLFVFSTEHTADSDVRIRSSGRFAHSEAYIERLAATHGFAIAGRRDTALRTEYGRPIAGRLFALAREGGSPARE